MPRTATPPRFQTFGDVLDRLGGVDPARVRLDPSPGRATVRDLVTLNDRSGRLYELVDGVLVEKVMGEPEAFLACELVYWLRDYLRLNDIGYLTGPDGAKQLLPDVVRVPDVAFVRWDRLPTPGQVPAGGVGETAPDLVVEVLSPGNTRGEVAVKLREYFLAGVRLVWLVDLAVRHVRVHTAPDAAETVDEGGTLSGGDVLPGFALALPTLFARLPAPQSRRRKKS